MDNFREILNSLKSRQKDMVRHFKTDASSNTRHLILCSPSDQGVVRNGGRRGAQHAPEAILAQLQKMVAPVNDFNYSFTRISSQDLEESNFEQGQKASQEQIFKAINEFDGENLIHLGGGHDHVYPLLEAIQKNFQNDFKRIYILNIDAHLDTRTDIHPHSGTPFRQFSTHPKLEVGILQLGIHSFSNALSNYSLLPNGEMAVLSLENLKVVSAGFQKSLIPFLKEFIKPSKETLFVLSFDCDALDASTMQAVSAVNPEGIPLKGVREIFDFYRELPKEHPNIIGIYEYNPLFDDLSNKGSKTIASLLYPFLK